jgi:predicted O-methyltransferase YrrM
MSATGFTDALAAAGEVRGWMTVDELTYLGREARSRNTVVEVGSYQGRSLKMLAATCPGTVFSVDNLDGVHKAGDELDRIFRDNMASEIESGKVRVIRKDSIAAAKDFGDGTVDMVFIDADHYHPAPANDIAAWLPKLAPSGLLCGHDVGFRDVQRALERYPHELVVDGIWKLT